MANAFSFARTPHLLFGIGKISALPLVIKSYGSKVLLVTGARSFLSSPSSAKLLEELHAAGFTIERYVVDSEPSPTIVDGAVKKYTAFAPEVVVAIGGGSVLDAGKAISAMLPLGEPVKDYLEGVGSKSTHPGLKIPFIAMPTTSGTGSEATKNAVISETGDQGYKKSLRHNNFVPDVAILDPSLTLNCPPSVTAASGMDAFTQLLESYLSTASNPITDALAVEGLKLISSSLMTAYKDGSNTHTRAGMSLASYLSGITLANAGLGLVHGFASSIGGFFNIPHGVICSSLMPAANKVTVRKLRLEKKNNAALFQYATVGRLFFPAENKSDDYYIDAVLDLMRQYAHDMSIPRLSDVGVKPLHYEKIVSSSGNKNNPVALNKDEMTEVLELTG